MTLIRMVSVIGISSLMLSLASCAVLPAPGTLLSIDGGGEGMQGVTQVLEVHSSGGLLFQAELTAWERRGERWHRAFGPWPVVVGRAGLAEAGGKREGDGRTPSGVFALRRAFGRDGSVSTGLEYRQSTADDFWVDDADSPLYNQWVKGRPQVRSVEQMLRPDGLYDLGAVIEYNTDIVTPGMGSAIFLHLWRNAGGSATAGCVALRKDRLRRLLAWLDSGKRPVIVLGRE